MYSQASPKVAGSCAREQPAEGGWRLEAELVPEHPAVRGEVGVRLVPVALRQAGPDQGLVRAVAQRVGLHRDQRGLYRGPVIAGGGEVGGQRLQRRDRKSTRLNSSHVATSY